MTSRADVAKMIDHTLLKPEATSDQVKALIAEAGKLGTYSICISPSQLPVEVPEGLHIATVVGFPSGAVKTEVKAAEAARAVADGAEEVDMVINIAFAKEHRFDDLEAEIKTVRDAIPGKVLKVIIESAALDDELWRLPSADRGELEDRGPPLRGRDDAQFRDLQPAGGARRDVPIGGASDHQGQSNRPSPLDQRAGPDQQPFADRRWPASAAGLPGGCVLH